MITRGPGFMRIFVQVFASISLVAACAVIGAGMDAITAASAGAGLFAVLVIHAWRVMVPGALPIGVILLAGLWVDCLTQGPLGLWALTYVAAAIAVDASMGVGRNGVAGHAMSITATLIIAAGLAWATASLFLGRMLPLGAWTVAAAQAWVTYVVVAGCGVGLRGMFAFRRFSHGETWP